MGDTVARSRLLAERVRAQHLTLERVRLAAYAGDAVARELLGPDTPTAPAKTKPFALGLAIFGKEAGVAAAIGAASTLVPLMKELRDERPAVALDTARAWLQCPCDEHRRKAAAALWDTMQELDLLAVTAAHNAAHATSRLDRTAGERARAARLAAKDAAAAAWNALWFLREPRLVSDALRATVEGVDAVTIRVAMERALRVFALGDMASGVP